MRLEHLRLHDFRNYRDLALALGDPWSLLVGANAQGKTNLLEAICLVCVGYSPRHAAEVEMIRWGQESARVAARVSGEARGTLELEARLTQAQRRQVRINGSPRRLADLIGLVGLVIFTTDDIQIVKGEPAARRRFLDTELGALSKSYYWNWVRYRRALEQRNRLLKEIGEQRAGAAALAPWDEQLVRFGAVVVQKRSAFIAALSAQGDAAYRRISAAEQTLQLRYRPALGADAAWDRIASVPSAEELRRRVAERLTQALAQGRAEELQRGMTMVGPQRDDFDIIAGGVDLHRFGSQGEQRSAAIALRLGLVRVVAENLGEPPLLLLDDVLSELDHEHRCGLFEALGGAGQVMITTTDADTVPAGVRASAARFEVAQGAVVRQG